MPVTLTARAGLDPDDFEAKLQANAPYLELFHCMPATDLCSSCRCHRTGSQFSAVLWTTPCYQNPTGTVMSPGLSSALTDTLPAKNSSSLQSPLVALWHLRGRSGSSSSATTSTTSSTTLTPRRRGACSRSITEMRATSSSATAASPNSSPPDSDSAGSSFRPHCTSDGYTRVTVEFSGSK